LHIEKGRFKYKKRPFMLLLVSAKFLHVTLLIIQNESVAKLDN